MHRSLLKKTEFSLIFFTSQERIHRRAFRGISPCLAARPLARMPWSRSSSTMAGKGAPHPVLFNLRPCLASEGLLLRGLNRVAMYYQNAPSEVITADTFVSLALLEGVQFDLQKRESSTAKGVEIDYQDLLNAESNVFIFFGGSQLDSLLGSFRQSLALFQACSYKLQSLHRRTETCCRRWML